MVVGIMDLVNFLHRPWQLFLIVGFGYALFVGQSFAHSAPSKEIQPPAKYPGPFLSQISDWNLVKQARSGDRHIETWKEHEKYGPIVRIAPNTVSINTIDALKEIYGSRKSNVKKSNWYRTIDAGSGAFSTHSELDKQRHAFRRRILNHAFSDSALRSAETFILENVRIWCNHLGKSDEVTPMRAGEWTSAKNMTEWSNYLSYDIMGDLSFGRRFKCMDSEEHRYLPRLLMRATEFVYVLGFLPCIELVRPLMGTGIMEFIGGHNARDSSTYIQYANNQIDSRIAAYQASTSSVGPSVSSIGDKPSLKDFTTYLLEARDPETSLGLTTAELHADSALLIAAGSDTTSLTLSASLFYLLHNPGTLTKLTKELRSAFASIDSIHSGQALNSCIYLRACIDEALRLAPPVPSHLPREVLRGGLSVDGEIFPAGTVVGTAPWAIHHSTIYFPDPFAFHPERWIATENDDDGVSTARAAFCAFSLGTRGCIGKGVAYLVASLALAHLLWHYDISLGEIGPTGGGADTAPNGWKGKNSKKRLRAERQRKDEYQLFDHFSADRDGPMVKFRLRTVE